MSTGDEAGPATPATEARNDFFVSYTSADRQWAEWVAWQLEHAGYRVVIQAWDFRPGSEFMAEMQRAYASANRVLAVLSGAYMRAPYARQEWNAALVDDPLGEKGKLVPVRVERCELQGFDRARIFVDLVDLPDEAAAVQRLLDGVRQDRAKPPSKPSFPGAAATVTGVVSSPAAAPVPAVQPNFPGRRPAAFKVPLKNNNFTGRGDLITQIHDQASAQQGAAVIHALHGLGGVGKTQLAVEYAYRYAADYDLVWWVPAQLRAEATAALAGLAPKLGVQERATQDETAALVSEELARRSRWLLIFDFADRPQDLRDYDLLGGSGHVLITTRNPAWGGLATPLPVPTLTRAEAVAFLTRRLPPEEGDEAARLADELAQELGDLPLALEQAASYMEQQGGMGIGEYLELFRERHQLLDMGQPVSYNQTVATTWKLAFDEVAAKSPGAVELLRLLAFLAPEDIPLDLLSKGAAALPAALRATVTDRLALGDALASLVAYSLVLRDRSRVCVHRLVQAVVRADLAPDQYDATVACAVRLLSDALPQRPHRRESWPACEPLVPHVAEAARHAHARGVEMAGAAELLKRTAVYLASHVQLTSAKEALQRALAIAEAAAEPTAGDDVLVADVLAVLGNVERELGQLDDAHAHLVRAVGIVERGEGPDSPDVVPFLSSLGVILRRRGQLAEAQDVLERALGIVQGSGGGPRLGSVLSDLGCVLWDRGELDPAADCFQKALAADLTTYGEGHAQLSTPLNYLGGVLRDRGDLEGAKARLEEALAIDRQAYGPDHPKVAARLNNLGSVLRRQGDLDAARTSLEEALAIDERAYGPDHFEVATVLSQLGIVKRRQGDLEGARADLQRALAIDEKSHGSDHVRVASRSCNLGDVLRDLGDVVGARAQYRRALAIFEATYGPGRSTELLHQKLARVSPVTRLVKRAAPAAGPR